MAAPPKSEDAFRTIGELADELGLPQHILRYWETRFPQLRPLQRAGNRRYYRPADVALVRRIDRLLNHEGYTIKGVQKLHKEHGVRRLASVGEGGEIPTPAAGEELYAAAPDVTAPGGAARERLTSTLGELTDIKARLDALLRRG